MTAIVLAVSNAIKFKQSLLRDITDEITTIFI
jgi:hypothetical protein